MAFEMIAHFNPGTLLMSEFIAGTHIGEGHTTGGGIAEEAFGVSSVIVVPESGSLMFLVGLGGVVLARRRS